MGIGAPKGEKGITKLIVRADQVQMKIEVTPVLRGCVYEPVAGKTRILFSSNLTPGWTRALISLLAVLFASGRAPVWAVALVAFSIPSCSPTIFALSLKDLGAYTSWGRPCLVMSIIGGAVPALMGRISDSTNTQIAFVIPLICHVYILYFALRGHKPEHANVTGQFLRASPSEAE